MTIDKDYIYDTLYKLTIDEGLWEDTDEDWLEVYEDMVDAWTNNWEW